MLEISKPVAVHRLRLRPLLLGLMVLALGVPAVQAQAPQWARIRVGVEANYPPFSQMAPNGTLSGFDIDIAQALCAEMKAQCTLVTQEWDGMMPALSARKFDMVVASMTITPERQKVADFSDSYYDIPSTFITRTGLVKDVSPTALKGKTLIVTRNTPRARYLAAHYKDSTILQVAKEADVTMELAAGRGDLGFGSAVASTLAFLKSPEGRGYAKVGPAINPSANPGSSGDGATGIAFRKGETELRAKVTAALKAITANGVYRQINDRYFDINIRGH